jgi:hypothetical protein
VSFDDFKLVYMLACFGLGLIILSPTLAVVVRFPSEEPFSEVWVLGPGHMAEDYPFNVKAHELYKVYLGVGNHMGGLEYYRVYVKFRNETEPLPYSVNGMPSVLDSVFEYRMFLRDGEVWEKEVSFSFENVSFVGKSCMISSLVVDGYVLNVDKYAAWDEENSGFYCQLFFELWIYNATVSDFQYQNRFVRLGFNMTAAN